MLFDETSDQVVRLGKSLAPLAQLWLRDPDHARFKDVVCEPIDYDGPSYNVWCPYHAFMRSDDGPGIVLRYLLDYPVDRQALTFGYGTEAKARDKVASDPVVAVLHEIAERGVCPHDRKAAGIISNKILAALVHQAGGRDMSPEEIANKLLDLIPQAEKSRNRHVEASEVCVVNPVCPGILIGQAVNERLRDLLVCHERLHRFDRECPGEC